MKFASKQIVIIAKNAEDEICLVKQVSTTINGWNPELNITPLLTLDSE